MKTMIFIVLFSLSFTSLVTWYVRRWERRQFDKIKYWPNGRAKHVVSDDYIAALRQAGAREELIKVLERERDRKR